MKLCPVILLLGFVSIYTTNAPGISSLHQHTRTFTNSWLWNQNPWNRGISSLHQHPRTYTNSRLWTQSPWKKGAEETEPRPKLVCFVDMWARTRSSPMVYNLDSHLPAGHCDYLVLCYLTMDNSTWTLKMHNGYSPVEPNDLEMAVRARNKSPGMKVLVSIAGYEDGVAKYSNMTSDSSKRKEFVQSVVKTLITYNLDGVDLQWLYPGVESRGGSPGDRKNFLQLVLELTRAFKPHRWILTASLPPVEMIITNGYDIRRLNSLLHHIHVLAIDMRGDWLGVAENPGPLYSRPGELAELRKLNVNDIMSMFVRLGASPKKLVPVFALFGRTYKLEDPASFTPGSRTVGPGYTSPFLGVPGRLAYYEICDLFLQDKLERHFEVSTQTPYAVHDDLWVGYDDEVSLQKKIKFVKDQDLAGAALLYITLDDFTGSCGEAHFLLKRIKDYIYYGS